MKYISTLFYMLIIGITMNLSAQNAPIATLGTINTSGTTAVVPITVTNFSDIASCALKIIYNPAVAIPTDVTSGTGMINGSLSFGISIPGVIRIAWSASDGVTLNNGSVIFNISFNKVSNGFSNLSFDNEANGMGCEYSNSSFQYLNDLPNSSYYIQGSLTFGNGNPAPIAFNVTGTGTFCAGGPGLPIGVEYSQVGVTYTLYKDGAPQSPTVAGTGTAISFGNFTEGTYTVRGTNGGGTTTMTGSAVISKNSSLPGSISGDQLISSGTAPAEITSTQAGSGVGTITYIWESSVNKGANWAPISGATGLSYAPGIQNLSTWYRRITISTLNAVACTSATEPVKINVTIKLNARVMLEGPLDGTLMKTGIHAYIPLSQPYIAGTWNYYGTEVLGAIPASMVDWVLVELRQAPSPDLATSSTILAKRAALLMSNGSIVDLDGTNPVRFDDHFVAGGNHLYVVIRHRNHLSIMSATGASMVNGVYNFDFTTGLEQTYGNGTGYKSVGSMFAMVAGDVDKDGSIYVSDYSAWAANFGRKNGYYDFDIDMDGTSYVSDYSEWANNFGALIKGGTLLKSAPLNPEMDKPENIKPRFSSSVPK